MTNDRQSAEPRVIVGVDTHKDTHVAVAIDTQGRHLGELITPAAAAGYKAVEKWASDLGEVEAFGIEGTGSFGAGLCRHLQLRNHRVVEVNRPDRSQRRMKGKSDPLDAQAAARAVLAGIATAIPKNHDDQVEMIRVLKIARRGAVKAKSTAATTLQSMSVSLPSQIREQFSGLSTTKIVRLCAKFRVGDIVDPITAAKASLRSIARRHEQLEAEIKVLDEQLEKLTPKAAPRLVELFGAGIEVASTLLVAAGDNPERLASESSFASLCGVSPVPASSGRTNRHRLNRGGNRLANSAIHTMVLVRMRYDDRTKKYVERRTADGLSKREIIRCLKRYVVREIYRALIADGEYRTSRKVVEQVA